MAVQDNLLVIRMGMAGLTQRGSSWPRERVCGRGRIRKDCGNVWKNQKRHLSWGAKVGAPLARNSTFPCELGIPNHALVCHGDAPFRRRNRQDVMQIFRFVWPTGRPRLWRQDPQPRISWVLDPFVDRITGLSLFLCWE